MTDLIEIRATGEAAEHIMHRILRWLAYVVILSLALLALGKWCVR